MGRRKYPRVEMALPVKVWTGSQQQAPLGRDCVTVNVTPAGVCLKGLLGVKAGEIVTLVYHHKECRFRVMWVGTPGSPHNGLAGLENLEPEKRIFGVDFSPPQPDEFPVSATVAQARAGDVKDRRVQDRRHNEERRAYPRYACNGSVEVSQEGMNTRTWGRVTDIALGGCYIEMFSPFPPETPLELVLNIAEMKVKVNATAKALHPGFGMGVQFTRMSDADRDRLVLLVNWLAGGAVGTPDQQQPQPPPQTPAAVVPRSETGKPDAGAALEALVRWFNQRNVLTKQEFLELLEKSRKQPPPGTGAAPSKP